MTETDHTSVPTREKVLIVGAGPAGLAAAASLRALDVPFDLVDRAQDVGGIWNATDPHSATWPAMRPISSKEMTQFPDLVMPVSFPAFPSVEEIGKYLRAYAAHHRLTRHFEPGVEVRRAVPFEEGVWQVELSNGQIRVYRALVLAPGITSRPHLPAWAEGLQGGSVRLIHSRDWEGSRGLEGKRVLVVGSGQSAADIAVDAASRALEVHWSARSGHWVVPRQVGPVPGDVAAAREPAILGRLNEKVADAVIGRLEGNPADVGLPTPETSVLEDTVIVSDDVLARVREGRVTPAAQLRDVQPDGQVTLEDGSTVMADVIVAATGYEGGIPFLDDDALPRTSAGTPDLFLGAFPRHRDDLVVMGQMRLAGGIFPILAQQADIAAYFLDAVRRGSRSAEDFRRLRTGSDESVATRTAGSTRVAGGGLRERLAQQVDKLQAATRRSPRPRRLSEEGLLPFLDRADLSARLHAARTVFEQPGS
ncbi:MAG: NAD(P)-binding domain-containing protein [Brachybacterium sp.]|nr:NAD(P)-binding domain-containing protein [Brachybacterium sp.]